MVPVASWLRLAATDLKGSLGHFRILLACLALGVGIIAAVGSVSQALQSAVTRDARVLLGGDLEAQLTYRPAKPGERAFLDTLGKVSEVVEISARAGKGDKSAFINLRAVDGAYPLVGTVEVQSPSGGSLGDLLGRKGKAYGAVVDQRVLDRLGIKLGETFTMGTGTFVATGLLKALPDQAAVGFQIGAPVLVSLASLRDAGLVKPGVLARYRYKILLDGSYSAAADAIKAKFPDAGWRIRAPQDATSRLRRFFDLFGKFLELVGLSTLLVGGVGVSNAVAAYLADRQAAIATLKSLGATHRRVVVHFLFQIMLLALLGSAIGIALGVMTSLALLPVLGGYLGLDLAPSIDPLSLVIALAFGFLIALAFGLPPLARTRHIRPAVLFRAAGGGALEGGRLWRELVRPSVGIPLTLALAGIIGLAMLATGQPRFVAWYAAGAAVSFALLRAAAALLRKAVALVPPVPAFAARIALSNIYRPGSLTVTVVQSLGLGLTLLIGIALVDGNLRAQLGGEIARQAPSFVMFNMQAGDLADLRSFARAHADVTGLDSAPVARGMITRVAGTPASDLKNLPHSVAPYFRGDQAFTWSATLPEGQTLAQGKWWPRDYSGPQLVSLGEEMRKPLDLKVGDNIEMTVSGRPVKAKIASFRNIDEHNPRPDFMIVFSPGLIEHAPATYIATMKTAPGREQAIEDALVSQFPALTFVPVADALKRVRMLIGTLSNAVGMIGGVAVIAGALVLAGAISAGRRQRESDAVIMKVLGATRRDLTLAYLIEYGVLGILATVLATALGSAGAWAIVTFVFKLDFVFDPVIVAAVLAGVVVLATATGLVLTWSTLSVRPARFLRSD